MTVSATAYRDEVIRKLADLSRKAQAFTLMTPDELRAEHACGYANWQVFVMLLEAIEVTTRELTEVMQ